jgi:stage IV sporulation protein A
MENDTYRLYNDIKARTNGEIYIGVVGPVRTGKSTFIRRFMELLVLPAISDENNRTRAIDELPQASGGKTVMTTEPKFIPKDAIEISVSDGVSLKVRMIDCVGFMVDGAEGHLEDGKERLVRTPWYDYDIPFTKAAEIGTKKVISEHSTLGIVVTNDGSITDIKREGYIAPEERTVQELKKIGKPFVIVLNSQKPAGNEAKELARELTEKYQVPVLPVNCDQLKQKDVDGIFEKLLLSFPITELRFQMPKWLEAAEDTAEIKQHIIANARTLFLSVGTVQDILGLQQSGDEYIDDITVEQVSLADGTAQLKYQIKEHYYYDMLSNMFQKEIRNEYALFRELKLLAETRSECARISMAMKEALNAGYGTVPPEREEIVLEEPAMIKSGNRYGVKIRATAPSIHLIKANISTEIAPIVGSEEQARDLVQYIQKETEANPEAIWDVSIFGKTVSSLVEEGMSSKINKISQDCQQKLQSTMEKIVNESNGGMVCIII